MPRILLACILFLVTIGAATAQRPEPPHMGDQLKRWDGQLTELQEALESDEDIDPAEAKALEQRAKEVLFEIRAGRKAVELQLPSLRNELDSLGPAPAEGEPAAPDDVAALRETLSDKVAELDGSLRRADLMRVRAEAFLGDIARRQQARVLGELLTRLPPPITPEVWANAAGDFGRLLVGIGEAPVDWVRDHPDISESATPSLSLLFSLFMALLIGRYARRFLKARFARDPGEADPSYANRLLMAVVEAVSMALLPALALFFVYLALISQSFVTGDFGGLIEAALINLGFFLVGVGVIRAVLAPRLPQWRLVPVTPAGAVKIGYRGTAVVLIVAISSFLRDSAELLGFQNLQELGSVYSLVESVLIAGLLLSLLPSRYWRDADGKDVHSWWQGLRFAAAAVFLACPLLALFGFAILAQFLLWRIVASAVILGAALLLLAALHEGLSYLLAPKVPRSPRINRLLGLGETGAPLLLFWLRLVAGVVLVLPLTYVLLLLWDVPATIVNVWMTRVLTGFEIGDFRLSISDLLVAIGIFLAGLVVVGWLRRWLAEKALPSMRLDIGVRNSIASGVSYLGIGIATMLAVSALGLDFSNLALVAGALSVGVGFGLRTIVENFVSGILLLIERPVKEGDWIVVAGSEGQVRRISVRSTEIETFDRASVIVPNSELISSQVTNWTHKNRTARIKVQVGVAYGSDTEKVRDILLHCAKEQEHVSPYPAPSVLFRAFGESSLDFELRCYVPDTDYYLSVTSDLHFAIDKAFRQAGIEIPFPQRDLHMKQWPAQGGEADLPDEAPSESTAETKQQSVQLKVAGPETNGSGT